MRAHIENLETRRMLADVGATSLTIGNTLYFAGTNAAHGTELWKSNLDGSDAQLVADLNAGAASSSPDWMANVDGTLYFSTAGLNGSLFKSDGTTAGTVFVGSGFSGASQLTNVDGTLFFSASEVDSYLYEIAPGSSSNAPVTEQGGWVTNPHDLVPFNGQLLFESGTLGDYAPSADSLNVVNSDSTEAQSISPTPATPLTLDGTPGTGTSVFDLMVSGNLAYFLTATKDDNFQQWQTDGTLAGTLPVANPQTLVIDGTSGNDVVNLASSGGLLTVTINGAKKTYDQSTFGIVEIHLGDGNDKLSVDPSVDIPLVVYGEAGNDSLAGGSADDMIVGGDGNDVFDASSVGNDWFIGGAGNDTMDYSRRSTSISYDVDNTGLSIVGSDGEHDLFNGVETLIGSQANDTLDGGSFLYVDGRGGDDVITYQGNQNVDPTIHGGDGNDTLNVKLFANFDDDAQSPGPEPLPAEVYGDAGNDTMLGGMSADNFFGGDGIDTIDYSQGIFASYTWDGNRWLPHFGAGVNISIDNKANDGVFGEENVHSDIEVIIGSSGPDTITTNGGNDTVIAGANDQVIQGPVVPPPVTTPGNNGGDTTTGNSGGDTTTGNGGGDSTSASEGPDNGTLPSLGGPAVLVNGVLTIGGSDIDDDQIIISRSPGDPSMLKVLSDGGYGGFKLSQISKIIVSAGGGNDLINFNEKYGAITFPSTIYGGAGNDTITGGSGADRIYGGDGNDWIDGQGGNDIIYGDAGNDRLFGGAGKNYLNGGAGTNFIDGQGNSDTVLSNVGDDIRASKGDVLDQLQA